MIRARSASHSLACALALAGTATAMPPVDGAAEMAERVVRAALARGPLEADGLIAELLPFGEGGVTALLERAARDQPRGTLDTIRSALRGLPSGSVAWLKVDERTDDERDAVAAAALAAVRELGTSGDLATAIAVASSAAPARPSRALVDRLERAVEEVLRRDADGFEKLRRLYVGTPEGLRVALVRAVGDTLSERGLALLVQLLGCSDLDVSILSQISRTAVALGPTRLTGAASEVRSCLHSASAEMRRESALAVGRLNDAEAIPDLIALLEDEHRGVRENAHWALQQVTGIGRAADIGVWRRWYETELTWWERDAPDLLRQVEEIELLSDSEIAASINELGSHRLFREELAQRLFGALAHRDPRVVRMACVALQQFEARSAIPELIELLGHRDRSVQQQAWTALKAITGRDLPLQRAAWLRTLS